MIAAVSSNSAALTVVSADVLHVLEQAGVILAGLAPHLPVGPDERGCLRRAGRDQDDVGDQGAAGLAGPAEREYALEDREPGAQNEDPERGEQ